MSPIAEDGPDWRGKLGRPAPAEQPQPEAVAWPKVWGTGRTIDNPRALLVVFDREPTDDEMRAFDEAIKGRAAPPPAAPEPSEAEVEAACAVYDALGPTTDRGLMADALRAAAAARGK